MTDQQITKMLDQLGNALSDGDLAQIALHFAPPALVLTDDGATLLADAAAVAQIFAGALAAHRAQGIAATRPELQRIEPLSERLVAVDVRWRGLDAAGTELASERSHYLLWLDDEGQPRIRAPLTRTR